MITSPRLRLAAALVFLAIAPFAGAASEREALERYHAGDYEAVARIGLDALAKAPSSHELRFAVANSLAWTGRYQGAAQQYRALFGTPYDSRARVGLGNVMRWSGQADLAEPHYRAVLDRDPGNEDARSGLALAGRDLQPAVTLRLSRMADNEDLSRNELAVGYRLWSADRAWRLQLGALAERNRSPLRNWSAGGVEFSLWAPQLPLAPMIETALYDSELRPVQSFAVLQLEPVRERARVRFGRVNWARLAFNAGAAADGLTAGTIGMNGNVELGLGSLRGRLDAYEISDGNRVLDGELQVNPWWQPLPYGLKWLGGVYGRDAKRTDPRYWSPDPAYGLAFLGLQRGWYAERYDVTAAVRRGFAFTDTARNSWSASLSARYWLLASLALGVEGWAVDSPRPSPYRLYQIAAFVQQLW